MSELDGRLPCGGRLLADGSPASAKKYGVLSLALGAGTATTGVSAHQAALTGTPTDSWPTYNGDFTGRRFSTLTDVNTSTVNSLGLGWVFRVNNGTSFGNTIGRSATYPEMAPPTAS